MFLILPEKPYIYNNYFLHFIPYKILQTNIVYITCQNPTYYPKKKRGKKPMDHFHTRTHKNRSHKRSTPKPAPHKTKFHDAPCHSPVSIHTAMTFLT